MRVACTGASASAQNVSANSSEVQPVQIPEHRVCGVQNVDVTLVTSVCAGLGVTSYMCISGCTVESGCENVCIHVHVRAVTPFTFACDAIPPRTRTRTRLRCKRTSHDTAVCTTLSARRCQHVLHSTCHTHDTTSKRTNHRLQITRKTQDGSTDW